MTMKWGPWVKFEGRDAFPEDTLMAQMVEVAYISQTGQLKYQTADLFSWVFSGDTVAYRMEIVETTQVLYGTVGNLFLLGKIAGNTHKITYTINQHGDVLSCKMEKL